MIQKKCYYKIKGNSEYFKKKYGTSNPMIYIEGTDHEIWGKDWLDESNPACFNFAARMAGEPVGKVWYGKIITPSGDATLGELVCERELG